MARLERSVFGVEGTMAGECRRAEPVGEAEDLDLDLWRLRPKESESESESAVLKLFGVDDLLKRFQKVRHYE